MPDSPVTLMAQHPPLNAKKPEAQGLYTRDGNAQIDQRGLGAPQFAAQASTRFRNSKRRLSGQEPPVRLDWPSLCRYTYRLASWNKTVCLTDSQSEETSFDIAHSTGVQPVR
ncbi:hypothetical protein ACGC1H_001069 [Rhizoctonia solani]